MSHPKTVLVTGSNSGLGLEAAQQLARKPEWSRIVLGARSEEKARGARDAIVAATGRKAEDFVFLVVDLVEPDSVDAALRSVTDRDLRFDALVLNAGGMTAGTADGMPKAASGQTKMFAMNVGGHGRLVEGMWRAGRLSEGATIVFAGSEAARGIPMMRLKTVTLPQGYPSLDDALWAVACGEHVTGGGDDMTEYGLVKLIGSAWMRELAHRHGDSLRALSISPGMTTGTSAAESMAGPMRFLMQRVMMPLMSLLGKAHDVSSGAKRYLRGLEDGALENGGFYASAAPGLVGPLTLQSPEDQPLLADDAFTRAVGRLIDRVAEGAARAA